MEQARARSHGVPNSVRWLNTLTHTVTSIHINLWNAVSEGCQETLARTVGSPSKGAPSRSLPIFPRGLKPGSSPSNT